MPKTLPELLTELMLDMARRGLNHPNRDQSWTGLARQATRQEDLAGMALLWCIPNELGDTVAVYCISAHRAIPQPAKEGYPNGYWMILPEGSMPSAGLLPVPAEQLLRTTRPGIGVTAIPTPPKE